MWLWRGVFRWGLGRECKHVTELKTNWGRIVNRNTGVEKTHIIIILGTVGETVRYCSSVKTPPTPPVFLCSLFFFFFFF